MPSADPMRKHVKTGSPASDGPLSQTMTRFSSTASPTQQHRTSPSSAFSFAAAASPPSPLSLKQKTLTINPELTSSTPSGFSPSSSMQSSLVPSSSLSHPSSSSVRSLLSRFSTKRDSRQWVASTPKGADAVRFRHFCPICYRHFASILATSCCAHNICTDCATAYLQAKLPNYLPLAFLPAHVMPCPCPTCNQSNGVRFIRITETSSGRSYVESPRTAALIRQHQEGGEAEMEESHYEQRTEGLSQLQQESERVQRAQAVMA